MSSPTAVAGSTSTSRTPARAGVVRSWPPARSSVRRLLSRPRTVTSMSSPTAVAGSTSTSRTPARAGVVRSSPPARSSVRRLLSRPRTVTLHVFANSGGGINEYIQDPGTSWGGQIVATGSFVGSVRLLSRPRTVTSMSSPTAVAGSTSTSGLTPARAGVVRSSPPARSSVRRLLSRPRTVTSMSSPTAVAGSTSTSRTPARAGVVVSWPPARSSVRRSCFPGQER